MSKHTKIKNPFQVGTKDYYNFVRQQLGSGHPEYWQVAWSESHGGEFAQIEIVAQRESGPKIAISK